MAKYESKPLNASKDDLELIFSDIIGLWKKNDWPNTIEDSLNEKRPGIESGKLNGLLLYKDDAPAGMAWIDLASKHYGNTLLHTLTPEDRPILAQALIDSGLLKNNLLEMIHFDDSSDYLDTFLAAGLWHNRRQRMGLELGHDTYDYTVPEGVTFAPFEASQKHITSHLSYIAHDFSKDQVGYPDLDSPEKRLRLEEQVLEGNYGKIIQEASYVVLKEDRPVGALITIEIKCWGMEQVPWVFDISLHPEFMGQGIGKLMMLKALNELTALGYPAIGLAVTLNNTVAIRLYEKLGFQVVEEFSEVIDNRRVNG